MTNGDQVGEVEIERASERHLAQIAELAESRNLENTTNTAAGFLVSGWTEQDYRSRLATAEHFYVAVEGDKVLGFLLAYDSERLEPEEWLNRRVKAMLGEFLVIKQICIGSGSARRGIASMLYYHVLDRWTDSPIIAAVVDDPPNEASARFHRKLGFQELTNLTPPDGKPRVVWIWRRPHQPTLQAQYSVSVDLYLHEDTTNWQKLRSFFYITAALTAALGVSMGGGGLGAGSGTLPKGIAIIIAVIGFGTSLAFTQMLYYGRRYLLARKLALAELEDRLIWHGGQRVVTWRDGHPRHNYLRSSPTGLIMAILPAGVAMCWLAAIGVLAAG